MKRMTSLRVAAVAAAAAGALILSSCAGGPSSTDTPTDTSDTTPAHITALYAAIAYEPAFIAQEQGYFTDAGLDVELKAGGAPQDNIAQVVGGSADLAITSWDTMTTSVASGVPVRAVAANTIVSATTDTSGIVVLNDSGINSLADLKGRTVAFDSLGSGGSSELFAAMKAQGLSQDDIKQVAIPYAGQLAALQQHQVDAIFPSEPFYSQVIASPDVKVISNPVREVAAGMPITLWTGSESWLDANSDAVTRFIDALQKGMDFYNDPANLDAVKQIRAEVTNTDAASVSSTLSETSVDIDKTAVTGAIQRIADSGRIDAPVPLDDILWSKAPTT